MMIFICDRPVNRADKMPKVELRCSSSCRFGQLRKVQRVGCDSRNSFTEGRSELLLVLTSGRRYFATRDVHDNARATEIGAHNWHPLGQSLKDYHTSRLSHGREQEYVGGLVIVFHLLGREPAQPLDIVG
jgi:hypothetical protein